jgi:RNA polymerase sigma factor (sigma-70 family)
LPESNEVVRFEQAVLPHLAAAFNLARWLLRNDHDAEDVVQEAYLRALKSFAGFHGGDGRAWLLAIVRNTSYTRLEQNRSRKPITTFNEGIHGVESPGGNLEDPLQQQEAKQAIHRALEELPQEYREVIVLRELEGLSYKAIAEITGVPMGTVMSRLARARERLQKSLADRFTEES